MTDRGDWGMKRSVGATQSTGYSPSSYLQVSTANLNTSKREERYPRAGENTCYDFAKRNMSPGSAFSWVLTCDSGSRECKEQLLRWMISRERTGNTGTPFVPHIGSGENPAPT